MPKHLYTIPAGSALPTDVANLPEGSPFIVEAAGVLTLYALSGGAWKQAGGGGGGGVRYGRFLPVAAGVAMSSVIDGDTPSPSAGRFTPASQPWGNSNFSLTPWGGNNLTSVADAFAGAGDGPRAIPALTTALQVPRFTAPQYAGIMFMVDLPGSGTGLRGDAQAWRVDLVYSLPADSDLANNSWFTCIPDSYDGADDRSVPGTIADADPSVGSHNGDWNNFAPVWGDGGTSGTHLMESFTVPGSVGSLRFLATVSSLWKPKGTDADLGPMIHYLRITPVLDGDVDGEMFLEQSSQALWLWDTTVNALSGEAGQGWYKVSPGRIVGYKEYEFEVHAQDSGIDLGRRYFANAMDINGHRLGVAANDRSPLVLTATVPVNAAAQDIVMTLSGAPANTSQLPFVVPLGLDWTMAKFAAYTAISSGNFTVSPTLTVNRISGSPAGGGISGTSAPYAPLTGTVLMTDASRDSGGDGFYYDYSAPNAELNAGDRLEFILHVPAGANAAAVTVMATLYMGGMAE